MSDSNKVCAGCGMAHLTEDTQFLPNDAVSGYDYDATEKAKIAAAVARNVSDADVLNAVNSLALEVREMRDAFTHIVGIAETVKEQVEPFMTKIESHPMARMLFGKGGK